MEFLAALTGALVGGGLALVGSYLAIRSERTNVVTMMRAQDLQQVATELPIALHRWVRAIVKMSMSLRAAGDDALQEDELLFRRQVLALRNRLPVDDDIAAEIDQVVGGYIEWIQGWALKPVVAPSDIQLPDDLSMKISSALMVVTANLPGRLRDLVENG